MLMISYYLSQQRVNDLTCNDASDLTCNNASDFVSQKFTLREQKSNDKRNQQQALKAAPCRALFH